MTAQPSGEPSGTVDVHLSTAEALVLFDWLSRLEDVDDDLAAVGFEHAAEPHALTRLLGALEKRLAQPFEPDWRERLAAARTELTGEPEDEG